MPIDTTVKQFEVVYVPADPNINIQQCTVNIEQGKTIEAMIEFVKKQIEQKELSRRNTLSQKELENERQQVVSQLQEQIKNNPQLSHIKLTNDIIDRIYANNAVDCVVLEQNCPATNYNAVMMYVDDQGVSKQLPRNDRATGVCFALGSRTEVLGDAYIASFYDNDDDFYRYDFTLQSLGEERWIKLAKGINQGEISRTLSYQKACEIIGLPNDAKDGIGALGVAENKAVTSDVLKAYTKANTLPVVTSISGQTSAPTQQTISSDSSEAKKCARGRLGCDKVGALRCTRCKQVYYCGAAHQKLDWPNHKASCIKK